MRWHPAWIASLPVLVAPAAYAADYLDIEQVRQQHFAATALRQITLTLDEGVQAELRRRSGIQQPFAPRGVWQALSGGWLISDEVFGRHEKIGYAVALDAAGRVTGVEILSYRESYGGEVRKADWRAQFVGRRAGDALELGADIRNISGATLSCKHVTQGVRRVLALYQLVLSGTQP